MKKLHCIVSHVASLFIICLFVPAVLTGQDKVIMKGEELRYIVYYGFIEIGEVKMKVISEEPSESGRLVTASCEMRSFEGIPFVELDSRFESDMIIKNGEIYSREFRAVDRKEEGTVEVRYNFNYDSGYVKMLKTYKGKTEVDGRLEFDKRLRFQDGLSLFYQARINSYSNDNRQVPVFMNEAETNVSYFFSTVTEELELDELDAVVNCLKCSGMAAFVGVFGLTGEFAGWFSSDDARVPVMAKMNVLVGNVTLELVSYKRTGWRVK